MSIKIQSFGVLEEITGKNFELVVNDLDELKQVLSERFSELKNYTYIIAVNKNIMQENVLLHPSDEVALLPPYSGG